MNASSWRGTELKTGTILPFTFLPYANGMRYVPGASKIRHKTLKKKFVVKELINKPSHNSHCTNRHFKVQPPPYLSKTPQSTIFKQSEVQKQSTVTNPSFGSKTWIDEGKTKPNCSH
jgi:hypothetical protein